MLVDNVMDAAFRRDTFQVLESCKQLCGNRAEENVSQRIYNIIDDVMTGYNSSDDIPQIGEVIDEIWEDIERHQDGQESGIPFKFETLNEYVRLEPGELVVIGAPAKGAKSMFCLNTAVDILRQGKSVMYIDSELSDRLFLCRMLSHLTGIEFNRIRNGRYTPEEATRIREQMDWLRDKKFVHQYIPIFQRDAIYTAVKRIDHKFGKLDVLIVDYLKSTGDADAYATYAELGKLTDMIKNDLAGKMDIAGLAAAQLTANGKLADSAKIARNASTIMVLLDKTPEEMEADGVDCGNKKLMVQLNRNGMQHAPGEYIDIAFNGNVVLLSEARQHIPETPY
jgi:replicative DNA helicase